MKNDGSIQAMITKHLRSQPPIETLELLVETLKLQLDLNTVAGTSQEIVPYDISFHSLSLGLYSQLLHSTDDDEQQVHSQLAAQLDDTSSSSRPCMDDFTDEDECFPKNSDDGAEGGGDEDGIDDNDDDNDG